MIGLNKMDSFRKRMILTGLMCFLFVACRQGGHGGRDCPGPGNGKTGNKR